MKKNTVTEKTIEYAGYVKNTTTGEYDRLFVTECSAHLAKGRAKEEAETDNKYHGTAYDTEDIIVKERTVEITHTYGEWADSTEYNKSQRELKELMGMAEKRFKEEGIELTPEKRDNVYYTIFGRLEYDGYEAAIHYIQDAKLLA